VDAAAPFGRRDALDAVAAGLVAEAGERRELERGRARDEPQPVQSAVAIEQAAIGRGEIGDEQAGIIAAFAGANFDNHGESPECA
jgi:hypothetical protein